PSSLPLSPSPSLLRHATGSTSASSRQSPCGKGSEDGLEEGRSGGAEERGRGGAAGGRTGGGEGCLASGRRAGGRGRVGEPGRSRSLLRPRGLPPAGGVERCRAPAAGAAAS